MKLSNGMAVCVLAGGLVAASPVVGAHGYVSVGVGVARESHATISIASELSSGGVWVSHVAYGWVWRPHVSVSVRGWHPYRDGGAWCGFGRARRWESHYGWGGVIYSAGGRWVLTQGSWCWLPPRGWAHCPPPPHRVVVHPHVVRHPVTVHRPVGRSCGRTVVVRHPYYAPPRHVVRPPVHRRVHQPANRPVHRPVHRPVQVTPRAPHVPPKQPVYPPAASRVRPQSRVQHGGRLDALVRRHRGR